MSVSMSDAVSARLRNIVAVAKPRDDVVVAAKPKKELLGRVLIHVNQHDKDYLIKTACDLALKRRCGLLSNYFNLLLQFDISVHIKSCRQSH